MNEAERDERRAAFEAALANFRGENKLGTPDFDGLSALRESEVGEFTAVWETMTPSLRARRLRELRLAAEDALRLDFTFINHLAIEDSNDEVRLTGVVAGVEDDSLWLLDHLLEMMVSDPNKAIRQAATDDLARFTLRAELEALLEIDVARLRTALFARVRDESEDVGIRRSALAALGYFSDKIVSDFVGASFEGTPRLRLGAIRAMGHSADEKWTDALLKVLSDNEDDDERMEAVNALAEIEDERAAPALLELIDDKDIDVRLSVIRALAVIGGDEARDALLYAAEDPDATISAAADKALTDLETAEGEDDLSDVV